MNADRRVRRLRGKALVSKAFLGALFLMTSCDAMRDNHPLADIDQEIPSTTQRAASASNPIPTPSDQTPSAPSTPRLYPGTGVFIRSYPSASQGTPGQAQEGDVTLNFVETDVREVIRSVLGDVLHLNYTLDPKLQATVTIQTSHPLRRDDVLPALQEALRSSGIVLVESEGLYRAVPLDEAIRNGSFAQRGSAPTGAAFGTRIVPLRYGSAAEIQRLLQPFVSKGGQIEADTTRNLLIVSGTGPDIGAIMDMINTFDVDWLSGMSLGIFPLQTGTPKAVAKELDAIFSSGANASLAGVIKFVPIERINSVLVISPQRAYLDRAREWIARLDRNDENTPRIYEYHVQNSRARDLAKVLSQLLSSSSGQVASAESQGQTAPGTTPVQLGSSMPDNNTLSTSSLSSSSSTQPSQLGQANGSLGTPSTSTSGPAESDSMAASSVAGPDFGSSSGTGTGGKTNDDLNLPQARIVADDKNNALVIFAKPRDYRMIEDTIKRLDVVPLQVLIEATIAEVTLTDNLQYGVEWYFKTGASQFSFSNDPTGAVAPTFPGFNYFISGNNPKVVLSALSQITHVNIVSSPQLLVLDHHIATLQVGDQVPVPIQQSQSTVVAGAPVINTIQFVDTGVILRVSPRVNTNGLITLDIGQQVSQATKTTTSAIDAPTIQQRRVDSTITVQDGETIALGGLIQDNRTSGKDGVPILSDIPIIGNLFGINTNNATRTELLILLSPRVVRDSSEARSVTEELRSKLHAFEPVTPKLP